MRGMALALTVCWFAPWHSTATWEDDSAKPRKTSAIEATGSPQPESQDGTIPAKKPAQPEATNVAETPPGEPSPADLAEATESIRVRLKRFAERGGRGEDASK